MLRVRVVIGGLILMPIRRPIVARGLLTRIAHNIAADMSPLLRHLLPCRIRQRVRVQPGAHRVSVMEWQRELTRVGNGARVLAEVRGPAVL